MDNRRRMLQTAMASLAMRFEITNANTGGQGTIIVVTSPGTLGDLYARTIAEKINKLGDVKYQVENQNGAGGLIAINKLMTKPKQIESLLMATSGLINTVPQIIKESGFNPEDQLSPIAILKKIPFFLYINIKSEINSIEELKINYANKKIFYAIQERYGAAHLAGHEIFKKLSIESSVVDYKNNSQAILDVSSGMVDLGVASYQVLSPLLNDGKIKLISSVSSRRFEELKNIPAITESIPDCIIIEGWLGLFKKKETNIKNEEKIIAVLKEIFGSERKDQKNTTFNGNLDFFKYGNEAKKYIHQDIMNHTKLLKKLEINKEK